MAASFQIPIGLKKRDGTPATWSGDAPDFPWVIPESEHVMIEQQTLYLVYGNFYRYFLT